MTAELKIENRQVISLTSKGYKLVFTSKPINTSEVEAISQIAKNFFDTFDVNNIIPIVVIKPPPIKESKLKIKTEESLEDRLTQIWNKVSSNLPEEFRAKDFKNEISKIIPDGEFTYSKIKYYLTHLMDMKLLDFTESTKKYKKLITHIIPDEDTKLSEQLIEDRKSIIETMR